ncbi:MAG: hypothetical protein R3B70_18880 [Polyangiaceae bacterium]
MLADITRSNSGSEQYLVGRAIQRCDVLGDAVLHLFCRESQLPAVNLSVANTTIVSDSANHYFIQQKISDVLSHLLQHGVQEVEVYTFHAVVFKLQDKFRSSDGTAAAQIHPWSQLSVPGFATTGPRAISPTTSTRHWPVDFMPVDEALKILSKALASQNERVRMTDLRALLTYQDDRFRKSAPGAGAPGLISMLVHQAEDAGVLSVDRSDMTNPFLRLLKGGAGLETRAHSADGKRLSSPPASTPMAGPPSSRRTSAGPTSRHGMASVTATRRDADGKSRSQHFIDVLRSRELGPFSKIRQTLYDSLEEVMLGAPILLGSLLTDVVEMTRSKSSGIEYPWRRVRNFLIQLLSREIVLLDESGDPTPPTFSTLTRKIVRLREHWRLDFEGSLLTAIIEGAGDVCLADTPPLAGALYLNRSTDHESKIHECIQRLLLRGRVTTGTAPWYRLALSTPPHAAPSAVEFAST